MTDDRDRDALVAAVASAWRPRGAQRRLQDHPAWHDLDEAGRLEAYRAGLEERQMEAALDERGLSATGWAVLRRILPTFGE